MGDHTGDAGHILTESLSLSERYNMLWANLLFFSNKTAYMISNNHPGTSPYGVLLNICGSVLGNNNTIDHVTCNQTSAMIIDTHLVDVNNYTN